MRNCYSSFLFARWQQQFVIACLGWGFVLQISPALLPSKHCVTAPYKCTCQMTSTSVQRFQYRGTNMTDDGQTDRQQTTHNATETSAAVPGKLNRLRCKTKRFCQIMLNRHDLSIAWSDRQTAPYRVLHWLLPYSDQPAIITICTRLLSVAL